MKTKSSHGIAILPRPNGAHVSNPYFPKAPLVAREQVYVSLIPLFPSCNKGIRAGENGVVVEATKGIIPRRCIVDAHTALCLRFMGDCFVPRNDGRRGACLEVPQGLHFINRMLQLTAGQLTEEEARKSQQG